MPPEPAAPLAPAPPVAVPSAPPAAAPVAEPSSQDAFDAQFDLTPKEPATPPAAPAAAPAPKPGAVSAKPTAPAAKPAAAAPQLEHEEVDGIKVPKFKSDKDFRGWGLGGYKKAKTLETELQGLQTKYQELEQKVPTTERERQQLATKLADLEKKHNEVLAELNFSNYERSPEYKEKYEKPYQDAFKSAYEDISQLTVTEEDRSQPANEEGKYPIHERPAKTEDFDQIYQLPLGVAAKLAAKKFGAESAAIVMDHWREVRNLAKAAVGALNSWKETSVKRQQEQETQSVQTRERVAGLWTQVNADIKTKNPDLFGEKPDDKEWNEKLSEGTKMADAYFSDRSQQPVEQRVVFDAHVRNRVAAFPALVSENRRIKAQLEQANKDLVALRGSAPGAPSSASPTPPEEESTGALDAFDKKL